MDALTDILAHVRVTGSIFSRASLGAPWGLRTRGTASAIFHAVLEGSGVVQVDGEAPIAWSRGDLVVLPHGHPHTMADAPGRSAIPIISAPAEIGPDGLRCVHAGGGGARSALLCGTFQVDALGRELFAPVLPPALVLRGGDARTASWLDSTLRLLAEEATSGRAGADAVVGRLAEVLFVQVLRGAVAQGADGTSSWLAALGDPALARALAALHRQPQGDWSAARLAKVAGMSRSAFFERFSQIVGEPPSAYLTRWRMLLARRELRRGDVSVAEVAERVGYASEAAFSRAFKRVVGVAPSAWRRAAAA